MADKSRQRRNVHLIYELWASPDGEDSLLKAKNATDYVLANERCLGPDYFRKTESRRAGHLRSVSVRIQEAMPGKPELFERTLAGYIELAGVPSSVNPDKTGTLEKILNANGFTAQPAQGRGAIFYEILGLKQVVLLSYATSSQITRQQN